MSHAQPVGSSDYDVDDVANEAIEAIDAIDALGVIKAVVVVFDPADAPEEHVVYSNAGASDLLPVLKAMLARIEAGDLRMPFSLSNPPTEADPRLRRTETRSTLRMPVANDARWVSDADPA